LQDSAVRVKENKNGWGWGFLLFVVKYPTIGKKKCKEPLENFRQQKLSIMMWKMDPPKNSRAGQ